MDPKIQEIVNKINGSGLTRDEEKYLRQILTGEIKLEFGNRQQLELIRKLKSIDDIIADGGFDLDELKQVLQDQIDDYEYEIDELRSEMRQLEDKQETIEDVLKKLPTK